MPFTSNGVEYQEMTEEFGLEEGWDGSGPYAKKPYLVAHSQRFLFLQWLGGYSRMSGGSSGQWIRTAPQPYPDTFANIYAQSASMKAAGDYTIGSSPISYDQCIVLVTFRPIDWMGSLQPNGYSQIDPETPIPFATQELDFLAEWNQIPNSSIKFSDGVRVNTPVSKRTTIIRMVITWHQYPLIPMTLMKDYAESVNDAVFLGCNKGTVFLEGPKTVYELDSLGNQTQKLTMSFKWRKYDWNKVLRPDGLRYDFVQDQSDSTVLPYTYLDYSQLILPGINA